MFAAHPLVTAALIFF
jgi:hypothetical protein